MWLGRRDATLVADIAARRERAEAELAQLKSAIAAAEQRLLDSARAFLCTVDYAGNLLLGRLSAGRHRPGRHCPGAQCAAVFLPRRGGRGGRLRPEPAEPLLAHGRAGRAAGGGRFFFQRLVRAAASGVPMPLEQYRTLPAICDLVSSQFYAGRLWTAAATATARLAVPGGGLRWVNHPDRQAEAPVTATDKTRRRRPCSRSTFGTSCRGSWRRIMPDRHGGHVLQGAVQAADGGRGAGGPGQERGVGGEGGPARRAGRGHPLRPLGSPDRDGGRCAGRLGARAWRAEREEPETLPPRRCRHANEGGRRGFPTRQIGRSSARQPGQRPLRPPLRRHHGSFTNTRAAAAASTPSARGRRRLGIGRAHPAARADSRRTAARPT